MINNANPSIPLTSAFLAAALLGADEDAPGALADALPLAPLAPLAPVGDPSEAVVEPDPAAAVVVVDTVDVLLSDTVGRVNPPSLVLLVLLLPPMIPVGVGVASAAESAQ